MSTRHDNTRQHILEVGKRIIAGKGFASVGLNEILTAAGTPKGSFYHYFASKEQYGEALLQDYFAAYFDRIDALLADTTLNGRERLMRYWEHWHGSQCESGNAQKCLVVKLGAEVADLSDAMRLILRDGTDRVIGSIAALIASGIADGSLPDCDAAATARMLYPLWLGASLLGKLHRDDAALDAAMTYTRSLFER